MAEEAPMSDDECSWCSELREDHGPDFLCPECREDEEHVEEREADRWRR